MRAKIYQGLSAPDSIMWMTRVKMMRDVMNEQDQRNIKNLALRRQSFSFMTPKKESTLGQLAQAVQLS